MFQRLRRQMTLFCGMITSGILLLMTVVCLLISEKALAQNSYEKFLNNGNSCAVYLETQNVLSHKWIRQAEQEYGINLRILDNGKPLFFEHLDSERDTTDVEKAAKCAREEQGLDVNYTGSLTRTRMVFFQTEEFYACTALIPKGNGVLSMTAVYPLDTLYSQIKMQRILFTLMTAAAMAMLFLFSWVFTGKMLGQLEENSRKQTEFIASASHELRSPLAVISSSVQAIESRDGDQSVFIENIKSETARMSRLVGDMLSLASADNKSWSILRSSCELDTLILDVYEKYEPLLRRKNIRAEVVFVDDAVSLCRCDSSRISQVLGILVDNAVSYVPEGGKVRLGLEEKEKYFRLFVEDNGPGISDQAKETVFERFYRIDSARRDKQHFGLGLCIAKEIIDLHHGKIEICDTPGGGATFVIKLPK